MKNPSDFVYDLLCKFFNYIMKVTIKPDMEFDSVNEINSEVIEHLKNNYGIKGFIIDVDETVRFDMGDIPLENEAWLNMIKSFFKIAMLSNGIDGKMEKKFSEMGIVYISLAFKPLKRGFLKACNELDLIPEEIAVIGDDLFDDIHGGNRMNMTTIKVSGRKLVKKL